MHGVRYLIHKITDSKYIDIKFFTSNVLSKTYYMYNCKSYIQ